MGQYSPLLFTYAAFGWLLVSTTNSLTGSISEEIAVNNRETVNSSNFEDWEKQNQRELVRIISRHKALIRYYEVVCQ